MNIELQDNLPFITIKVRYQSKTIEITHVLIDTGSASTVISADILIPLNITPLPSDILYNIRGVGGTEVVFRRRLDAIEINSHKIENFEVEVAGMAYGFAINAIIGMDFLIQSKAIINLKERIIGFSMFR